jgi:hypothetical protein
VKRLALSDFLLRRLVTEIRIGLRAWIFPFPLPVRVRKFSLALPGVGGPSENDGIAVVETILWVNSGDHRQVDVPGLRYSTSVLPDVLSTALYCFGDDTVEKARQYVENLEIRTELLAALERPGWLRLYLMEPFCPCFGPL